MKFEDIQLPADYIASMYKDTLVIIDNPNINDQPQNAPIQEHLKEKTATTTLQPNKKQVVQADNNLDNATVLPFLGENKKKIAILVWDETVPFIREEWLQFLSNILLACKLNIGDVAIVNQYTTIQTFKALQQTLQSNYCIMFLADMQTLDLPFVVPAYRMQKHSNCSFLPAKPLSTYLPDDAITKEEKRKLWLSLKNLFNLK
ncbi:MULTISPECIES: hypothetical protein [Hydrotalea]|uniref:hypothetical protein n=1 Tax=Hydrotalea TaxID=1004300 RepID=UPI001C476CB9|nr:MULTISPECIES: hypothetical protein [Hydrotalea]